MRTHTTSTGSRSCIFFKQLPSIASLIALLCVTAINGQGNFEMDMAGRPGIKIRQIVDYPPIRFVPWEQLNGEIETGLKDIGYTQDTWNKPTLKKTTPELKKFDEFTDDQQTFLNDKLGIDKIIWDCYSNHYYSYTWDELIQAGVEYDYIALGWSEAMWSDNSTSTPISESKSWDNLSFLEKQAASRLCYWEETWNEEPLNLYTHCYFNHQNQYWYNLPTKVQEFYGSLGWSQQSWDGNDQGVGDDSATVPDIFTKGWTDLSTQEQMVAHELCYTEELWNIQLRKLPPYPQYRYTQWDLLQQDTQKNFATNLDYTETTWNVIDSANIEQLAWHSMTNTQQSDIKSLGFNHFSWDCYQNNYQDYNWDKLDQEDLQKYLIALGWTKDVWNANFDDPDNNVDLPDTDSKTWWELTHDERIAASQLCFTEETWDEDDLEDEWENCFWTHDSLNWDGLIDKQLAVYYKQLGWTPSNWETLDFPSDDLTWDKLSDKQRLSAQYLCFYEQTWNNKGMVDDSDGDGDDGDSDNTGGGGGDGSTPPAYQGLRYVPYDLIRHNASLTAMSTLGYTKEQWNKPNSDITSNEETGSIELLSYDLLTTEQQDAAETLGYADYSSWDCHQNHYYAYSWEELDLEGVQDYYVTLGFDTLLWSDKVPPGSFLSWDNAPDTFKKKWDVLTDEEKDAATKLCFRQETWDHLDMKYWNCWWNQLTEYWDELERFDTNVQVEWESLGYNQTTWDGLDDDGLEAPLEDKLWNDFTETEQATASKLCYTKNSWDYIADHRKPYPDVRYTPYSLLTDGQINATKTLGYTEDQWNQPDVNADTMEFNSFDELSEDEQGAAVYLGLNPEIWDCYISNFIDYTWEELGAFRHYYEALGWDETKWETQLDRPDSEDKTWSELTEGEQKAAKQLCFTPETWDGLPLKQWDRCWFVHHDKDWDTLTSDGVIEYYTALGWDETSWNADPKVKPNTWSMTWDDLLYKEMRAAEELCYYYVSWEFGDNVEIDTLPDIDTEDDDPTDAPTGDPTDAPTDAPTDFEDDPITIDADIAAQPFVRYTPFDLLTTEQKMYVKELGYTEDGWNKPIGNGVEYSVAYDELTDDQKNAATKLEISKDSWDCYINHYYGFKWSELGGKQQHAETLGWTESTWEDDDAEQPESYNKYWKDMTMAEMTAAINLCFIQETWDELDFYQWDNCFWVHSKDTWDQLGDIGNVQNYWMKLGWDEDSWSGADDKPATEKKKFAELSADERGAAEELCYYAGTWDSGKWGDDRTKTKTPPYPDFRFTVWHLLSDEERILANRMNYTELTWNRPDLPAGSSLDDYRWFENLEDDEQSAALSLGFTEDSWDCWATHYYDYAWDELDDEELQEHFITLGWTESMWESKGQRRNLPASESKNWDDLSDDEKAAATQICYIQEIWDDLELNFWDCYWNHNKFPWSELEDLDVQEYYIELGWNESNWVDGADDAPESDDLKWDSLTSAQQRAAEQLCYYEAAWNSAPRLLPLKPSMRFTPWSKLENSESLTQAAKDLNYNEDTWNRPDISRYDGINIEELSWEELNETQTDSAKTLGFTESSWDCYQNHYYAYTWDELKEEGVQKHFSILGWDEDMWESENDTPPSDAKRWDELTFDEKRAARDVCFFSEDLWNEEDMTYWDCYWNHLGWHWEELPDKSEVYWRHLGWHTASWDGSSDPPESESKRWDDLSYTELIAVYDLCYTETAWRLGSKYTPPYPNTRFQPWAIIDHGLLESAKGLGYTEETWDNLDTHPIEGKSYDELTADTARHAIELGLAERTWDCYQNHYKAYSWDELSEEGVQSSYISLGWDQDKWESIEDQPESEEKDWFDLSQDERAAAREVCYFKEDWDEKPLRTWDCFWDHDDDSWDELSERGLQRYWIELGWDSDSWAGKVSAPHSDAKKWSDLTRPEQIAADALCFYEDTWNNFKTDRTGKPTMNLSASSPSSSDNGKKKLSSGAIVGILIAALVFVAICIIVIKKRRANKYSYGSDDHNNVGKDVDLFPNTHVDVI